MIVKNTLKQQYHYVFFGGDKNYRLAPPGGGAPAYLNDELAQYIVDGRDTLWAMDTLNQSDLVKAGRYAFTYPKPNPLFAPTYKLAYKGNKKFDSINFARTPTKANALKAYFSGEDADDPAEIDEKRGQYNLGWLDRWGYLEKVAGTCTVLGYSSFPLAALSDHIPVLLKVRIA